MAERSLFGTWRIARMYTLLPPPAKSADPSPVIDYAFGRNTLFGYITYCDTSSVMSAVIASTSVREGFAVPGTLTARPMLEDRALQEQAERSGEYARREKALMSLVTHYTGPFVYDPVKQEVRHYPVASVFQHYVGKCLTRSVEFGDSDGGRLILKGELGMMPGTTGVIEWTRVSVGQLSKL